MKIRQSNNQWIALGSENNTLVVIHQAAEQPFQKGYSGLYHFAIHPSTKAEFAKMIYRVKANNYTFSPIDHTMSQSLYLEDPDGITIEFALETPERFKRVVSNGGLFMEDVNGAIHAASTPLNVKEIFEGLAENDLNNPISDECRVGHIHLFVNNVEKSNAFYKQLGFLQFNNLHQFMYADVGAGGAYQHRIAMNAWHGVNRPMAPKGSAGLRHYQLVFDTNDRLTTALKNVPHEEINGQFWVNDPTGNRILLSHREA